MTEHVLLWRGKQLAECNKEELIEAVQYLMKGSSVLGDIRVVALQEELARVNKENEKLWQALGARTK